MCSMKFSDFIEQCIAVASFLVAWWANHAEDFTVNKRGISAMISGTPLTDFTEQYTVNNCINELQGPFTDMV